MWVELTHDSRATREHVCISTANTPPLQGGVSSPVLRLSYPLLFHLVLLVDLSSNLSIGLDHDKDRETSKVRKYCRIKFKLRGQQDRHADVWRHQL